MRITDALVQNRHQVISNNDHNVTWTYYADVYYVAAIEK